MNIEKDIFKRSIINTNKLIKYGFKKNNDNYEYSKVFLNDFKAIISIDKNNNINGKVIDLSINEEYYSFRTNENGEFVNKIREEYITILNDIKNNCFDNNYFINNQTNRIVKYIIDKYHNNPEFLWDDLPGCGVFRNVKSKKWFAIIMNIDFSKLDNKSGEIEIINVKLNENEILELLNIDGFYKAYHMNKKSWISIVLNDTLDDEIIFSLIDESYILVNKK